MAKLTLLVGVLVIAILVNYGVESRRSHRGMTIIYIKIKLTGKCYLVLRLENCVDNNNNYI